MWLVSDEYAAEWRNGRNAAVHAGGAEVLDESSDAGGDCSIGNCSAGI